MLRLLAFYVDRLPTGLKETKSAKIQIRIDEQSYYIVDLFNGDFLVYFNWKELWKAILEDKLNLNPNRKHEHRHQENVVVAFALVLEVQLWSDCCYTYENLFAMIHVEWQFIEMTKYIPIGQVSN